MAPVARGGAGLDRPLQLSVHLQREREPLGAGEHGHAGLGAEMGRDAPILWDLSVLPPCDVFQANFRIVPATAEAYRRRSGQIATVVGQRIDPDVIAFQEVSGETAVREILPDGGVGYHVCSFQGFKVQRLAFAWRRELAGRPSTALLGRRSRSRICRPRTG